MSEKEIQPIAMDGKIIDFKTKEVIEDLDAKNKKRFTICVDSNNLKSLWDDERTEEEPLLWLTRSDRIGGIDGVCKLLNKLNDEKEKWKSASVIASNENSLLWNEIHILMEQGAEPSDAFKEYLERISTEHSKFWQRKLEQAKKDGVIK